MSYQNFLSLIRFAIACLMAKLPMNGLKDYPALAITMEKVITLHFLRNLLLIYVWMGIIMIEIQPNSETASFIAW